MEFLRLTSDEGIARVALSRGKVNAINEKVVEELSSCFKQLADDPKVEAVIFTGEGKFFTFGFDIPEFISYSKESFIRYLTKFTDFMPISFYIPNRLLRSLTVTRSQGDVCSQCHVITE